MYRFGNGTPTIPGYMVAEPGHEIIAASAWRAFGNTTCASPTKIAAMALERGLRVNTPLEPERRTGWIGIDFEDSERGASRLIDGASSSITARLRHSRQPALLYGRRRDRRVLRRARHDARSRTRRGRHRMDLDDRRPYPNWRRISAPFASGRRSNARRSAARHRRHDRDRQPRRGRARRRDRRQRRSSSRCVFVDRSAFMSGTSIVAAQRIGAARRRRLRAHRTSRRRRAVARRRSPRFARQPFRRQARDPRIGRRHCRAPTPARSISSLRCASLVADRHLRHAHRRARRRREPPSRRPGARRRQPHPYPAADDARAGLVDAPSVRHRRRRRFVAALGDDRGAVTRSFTSARRPAYRVFSRATTFVGARARVARCSACPKQSFLLGVTAPDIFIVAHARAAGAIAIAAFRALNVVSDLTFVVPSPLQSAAQIVIGQRLGAGDAAGARSFFERAHRDLARRHRR